ncbi:MAG: hypothetical protein D6790_01625, partial [Caldilineae bacterium]
MASATQGPPTSARVTSERRPARSSAPLAALLLFSSGLLLSQGFFHQSFYKTDAYGLIRGLLEDQPTWFNHFGCYQAFRWGFKILSRFGFPVYRACSLVVSLSYALSLVFVFLGFHRMSGRPRGALAATILFAICPPVIFFSTVVEHHAVFLAVASFAFYLFTIYRERPDWKWSFAVGLATGLASYFHASGYVL